MKGIDKPETIRKMVAVMFRSVNKPHRVARILDRLVATEDVPCLRQLVQFHGLLVLKSWLRTLGDNVTVVRKIVSILGKLPIQTRNTVESSKIEPLLEQLKTSNDVVVSALAAKVHFCGCGGGIVTHLLREPCLCRSLSTGKSWRLSIAFPKRRALQLPTTRLQRSAVIVLRKMTLIPSACAPTMTDQSRQPFPTFSNSRSNRGGQAAQRTTTEESLPTASFPLGETARVVQMVRNPRNRHHQMCSRLTGPLRLHPMAECTITIELPRRQHGRVQRCHPPSIFRRLRLLQSTPRTKISRAFWNAHVSK